LSLHIQCTFDPNPLVGTCLILRIKWTFLSHQKVVNEEMFPHTWTLSSLWSWDNMIHIRWGSWPISRKKFPNNTLYRTQHLTSMTETHYSQQEAKILPVSLSYLLLIFLWSFHPMPSLWACQNTCHDSLSSLY
jgi:hypothetical protein